MKRIKEDEFEAWKQNVKKFRFAAIGTIRKHISRTEAIKFNRSLTFGKLNFNHKINEEHNRMLAMLRVQVDKLIAIIEKYEENISATK